MVIQETTRSPCLDPTDHNGVEPDQPEDQPGLEEGGREREVSRDSRDSRDNSGTSDEEPEENDLNR